MKIFTRVNIVFVWTTKPRKYKNDDVKTLNQATVSDVSRALNKHALARVCLITITNTVRGISPKYHRILSGKSPSQRSPSSVPFCIREQHLEATQPRHRTR